jgi:Domain of Unknown Function (DUF1080)
MAPPLRGRARLLAFVVAVLAVAAAGDSPVAARPRWRPLFDGRDLAGWDTYLSEPVVPGVFQVETVEGAPAIHVSGEGFGTITTRESFDDFRLRLQFKWGTRRWGKKANAPRDSGLLYYGDGVPGAIDGNWPRSVEFQIQEHDTGDTWTLGTRETVHARSMEATPKTLYVYDPRGAPLLFERGTAVGNRCLKGADAEKPTGEWNTLELVSFRGESAHVVNGQVVMRIGPVWSAATPASAVPLRSGHISLQTEGAEVFFRAVEIAPLRDRPRELAP